MIFFTIWKMWSLCSNFVALRSVLGGESPGGTAPDRCEIPIVGVAASAAGVEESIGLRTKSGSQSFSPRFRRTSCSDISPACGGAVQNETDNSRSSKLGASYLSRFAERRRFELLIPFRSIHAFQACLLSHSSISPGVALRGRRSGSDAEAGLQIYE